MEEIKTSRYSSWKAVLIAVSCLGFGTSYLYGASEPNFETLRMQLVDMSEDMAFLSKDLGQMRLEMESLTRENSDLRQKVVQLQSVRNEFETHMKSSMNDTKAQVADLKKSWDTSVKKYKEDVLAQVTQQIEKLSDRTHNAMQALAKSVTREASTAAQSISAFRDDYPKEGLVYVIKQGDTLSHIAVKNHSTIDDIQNANRITDPRNLRPGQTLFIPQRKL